MRNPYREVLRTPGAPAFVAAGLLARLPISMYGLIYVFLIEDATGSYGAAGAVAACASIASALGAPVLSRLVDRHGQARVAIPALTVHTAGILIVLAATALSAPVLVIGLAAALAGASFTSWGSLVRARWAWALRDDSGRLHPAFSLESVLDEVTFTVGPPLATVLAVTVSPSVALGTALAATVLGGTALVVQRSTQPPVTKKAAPTAATEATAAGAARTLSATRGMISSMVGVMEYGGIRALALAFVATGVVFGSVEVIAVAFTAERGAPAAAGVVLALYSIGSLLAGLVFGAITWRGSLPRRFRLGAVGMAVLIAPVATSGSIPVLAATLFLSGLAISPTLISGNALVAELVPARQLTEGLAWIGTSLGLGVSLGAAFAGRFIDSAGSQTALLLPVVAAAVAALVVVAFSRALGVVPRSA
ncbi:Major Facilitator Superfamily protein [Quadrisphaera granulorum]|uniref:MFS transporter n=1 Tax=Quadrisphaera granulorum TaxID=317664 RepID=A0A316A8P0_9ACTN|nr:MFS transporter [Quadrisphaera granulorum]PWJ53204.1 MFS transporter [Quadrisphaera granulorum]SZE97136.1 Major Facilitator Superfamily protein [Quadrisphaera granulorum]